MGRLAPVIGQWYQNVEQGDLFEIVAIDEATSTLSIQYIDGEISELDTDSWYSQSMRSAAPPKDWTSPFEMEHQQEDDDLIDWNAMRDPINQIEADSILDFDDPV